MPLRRLTFRSPEETTQFAARLAPQLRAGDVLLLQGGLGCGKTHFARGVIQTRLAEAGRAEDVPSPTFTIVQTYDLGDVEIWHADLYRLTGPDEALELGLDEAFEAAICLIEWPDRLQDEHPSDALSLTFGMTDTPGERVLTIHGPTRWAAALDYAEHG